MNKNKRERKFLKGFKSIQSTIFAAVSVLVLCAVLADDGKIHISENLKGNFQTEWELEMIESGSE